MTDYTLIQSGDPDAAENVGAALGTIADIPILVEGLGVSNYDAGAPAVDLNAGKTCHILDTALSEWTDDQGNQQSETVHEVRFVCHLDARTGIGLTDADVNHVFVDPQWDTDDSPQIVVNTTNNLPLSTAVKIAEIDTSADTFTDQWNLSRWGTLSYPNQSAASSEDSQGRLPEGTNVYDRTNDAQFVVTA